MSCGLVIRITTRHFGETLIMFLILRKNLTLKMCEWVRVCEWESAWVSEYMCEWESECEWVHVCLCVVTACKTRDLHAVSHSSSCRVVWRTKSCMKWHPKKHLCVAVSQCPELWQLTKRWHLKHCWPNINIKLVSEVSYERRVRKPLSVVALYRCLEVDVCLLTFVSTVTSQEVTAMTSSFRTRWPAGPLWCPQVCCPSNKILHHIISLN